MTTARNLAGHVPRLALAAALLAASGGLALADGGSGGDRAAAGGAFMSSYARGPYPADPRSPWAQQAPAFEPLATGSVGREASPERSRRGAFPRR